MISEILKENPKLSDQKVSDILKEKGISPLEYKYFCLESHYRKQLMFSEEIFNNSVNGYRKLIQKIGVIENDGEIDNNAFNQYL